MKYSFLYLLVFLSSSLFSQKMVLMEKFTNAFCGACPNASIMIQEIMEEYPNVIWVNHHKPVTWTDNPLTNEQSIALWNDLNVPGVPNGMVDRSSMNNNIIMNSSQWKDQILSRLEEEHFVNLEVDNKAFDVESNSIDFEVLVDFESHPGIGNYNLSVLLVEDEVYGTEQHNYYNDVAGHPLEGRGDVIWDYKHRYVVRDILNGPWGTSIIEDDTPDLETEYNFDYDVDFSDGLGYENLYIVPIILFGNDDNPTNNVILNSNIIRFSDNIIISSIDDIEIDLKIKISPNPSSDFIYVDYNEVPDRIFVFNQLGQEMIQLSNSENQQDINISTWSPGVYMMNASYGKKNVQQSFTIAR